MGVVYVHICVHFKNLEKCNKLIMVIWVNNKNGIVSLYTLLYYFIFEDVWLS